MPFTVFCKPRVPALAKSSPSLAYPDSAFGRMLVSWSRLGSTLLYAVIGTPVGLGDALETRARRRPSSRSSTPAPSYSPSRFASHARPFSVAQLATAKAYSKLPCDASLISATSLVWHLRLLAFATELTFCTYRD